MKKITELINSANSKSKVLRIEEFDESINLKFTVKKIAFKIFFELKNRNLAQQDLAKMLDVTPQNISKLLKGDDYKLSTLVKIEEALSINLIDRDIYNKNNNFSIVFSVNTFEHKSRPLVVKNKSYFLSEAFESSENVLETEILYRTTKLEQSINTIRL